MGFAAGDANLTRYVANRVILSRDPTGLVDSVTKSFWTSIAKGNFDDALALVDDGADVLTKTLRCNKDALKQGIKQLQNLDKWKKQMLGNIKKAKQELKTLEKTYNDHLRVRGGNNTPETIRIKGQVEFLKEMLE